MSERPDVREPRRWQYALMVALCVIGTVLGVWLGATHPTRPSHHHQGVVFPVVFAVVGSVVVSAFGVFVLRRLHRRPAMQTLLRTDLAQRRATARAVQRREPLTAEQRDTAKAQLENLLVTRRRLSWLLPASIVSLTVAAILGSGSLRVFLLGILALGLLSTASYVLLYRVQIGRYRRALAGPAGSQ